MKSLPIKIIDTIHHKNKYNIQVFHVVDRMPVFLYEKKSGWLIGEDSGFFNFYCHNTPTKRFKAFAGRKFTIPLTNGGNIEADGQWWHGLMPDYQDLVISVGVGSPETLNRCNVFVGMFLDPEVIDPTIKPSNNYSKYDSRHTDYGKQTICSKW